MVPYDELSMLEDNAREHGIPWSEAPAVRRERVLLGDGRAMSALVWGAGEPELVFVHGGAQNAHTWDTVLLALRRAAVAVDLTGHGRSDGASTGSAGLEEQVADLGEVVGVLAPRARAVVGMSLGGLCTLGLSRMRPCLVRAVVLVDITPGVTEERAAWIRAFLDGPASFDDFDEMLRRTVEHNPTRTVSSLRRGILHNAQQRDDGTWVWRHARHGTHRLLWPSGGYAHLWEAVAGLRVPLLLVRGDPPRSVVTDPEESELLALCPSARVEHVEGAGHSVQGDSPVELAALIAGFVAGLPGPQGR